MQKKGELSQVCIEGLKEFVQSNYESLLKGEDLETYNKEGFQRKRWEKFEDWLMNRMEVTELFLISLNSKSTIDDYYTHFEDINDEKYNEELRRYFLNLVKGLRIP